MMGKIAKVCEKRPLTVIGVVALITVIMLAGIPKISTELDVRSFLPEGYPSLETTLEIENEFGGMQYEFILIESENMTNADTVKSLLVLQLLIDPALENYAENYALENPALENYIGEVRAKLEGYVIEVDSYLNYLLRDLITDNGLLPDNELEATIQSLLTQPAIRSRVIGKLLTSDQKVCLLRVKVNPDLTESEANEKTQYFEDLVKNYVSMTGAFNASVTGEYSTSKELSKVRDEDMRTLVPLAAILIIAILALAFRRPSDVVLPFGVIGLAVIWVLGIMGHFGISFSTVAVAILPLLMGICIDYALHMTFRYREERLKGFGASEAAIHSVKNTGTAVFLTAGTTAIGFGSWLTSDLPPLRDFGLLCVLGILFSFIFVVTVLPAFWVLRDRRKRTKKPAKTRSQRRAKKTSPLDWVLVPAAVAAERHPKKVAIAVTIITVVAIIFATQTTTAIQFEKFVPSDAETIQTSKEMTKYFPGQDPSGAAMVLVKGDITNPSLLAVIIQLENQTLSDPKNDNYVTSAYSIADYIVYVNGTLPQTSQETMKILENLRQQMPETINAMITPDNQKAIILFMGHAETDADLKQIADIVREHVDNIASQIGSQAELAVGGMPPISADLLAKIPSSALQTTLIAFVLVALALCAIFRSLKLGIICMVPLCLALIWEFGVLYVFDIPLNVITVLISALLVGIGIDFSIHLAYRYKEEWEGHRRGPEESVRVSVSHIGRAILAAAATTCSAFGILMVSRMPAMGIFGGIMALVILLCMLATLFVMPTLLVTYARRTKRRK